MNPVKRLLILISCSLVSCAVWCQSDTVGVIKEDSTEFLKVQQEAAFPGGLPAWKTYLQKNLDVDLADSCIKLKKGEKVSRQVVMVAFKVDKQGNISDVHVPNAHNLCPLLVAESIRVIRDGPKWKPAIQNNKRVIYRQTQPIVWILTEE